MENLETRNTLLAGVERTILERLNSVQDIPKIKFQYNNDRFFVGTLLLQNPVEIPKALVELFKEKEFMLAKVLNTKDGWKIIRTTEIREVHVYLERIDIFRRNKFFPEKILVDNREERVLVEFFDDYLSAKLFQEVGGFN